MDMRQSKLLEKFKGSYSDYIRPLEAHASDIVSPTSEAGEGGVLDADGKTVFLNDVHEYCFAQLCDIISSLEGSFSDFFCGISKCY
jgi:hypothetical protein